MFDAITLKVSKYGDIKTLNILDLFNRESDKEIKVYWKSNEILVMESEEKGIQKFKVR